MSSPVSPHPQELVDEVDEHGDRLRTVTRSEMRRARLLHRATFIAVVNANHEIVLHQRSAHKDLWPLRWDLAAGGVLTAGESIEDGARRELFEELGVSAPLTHLSSGLFRDADVAVLGEVFLAHHEGPFEFTDGEVERIEWVPFASLRTLVAHRSFCPDSVALVLPALERVL